MSEPLFLQSVMQEKILGRHRCAMSFGYADSQRIRRVTGLFLAHPNGVSIVKNGRFAGQKLMRALCRTPGSFGDRPEPVFPL